MYLPEPRHPSAPEQFSPWSAVDMDRAVILHVDLGALAVKLRLGDASRINQPGRVRQAGAEHGTDEGHRQGFILPAGDAGPGNVPDPLSREPGCPFAPRCTEVMQVCRREEPQLLPLEGERKVSCFLHHPAVGEGKAVAR